MPEVLDTTQGGRLSRLVTNIFIYLFFLELSILLVFTLQTDVFFVTVIFHLFEAIKVAFAVIAFVCIHVKVSTCHIKGLRAKYIYSL